MLSLHHGCAGNPANPAAFGAFWGLNCPGLQVNGTSPQAQFSSNLSMPIHFASLIHFASSAAFLSVLRGQKLFPTPPQLRSASLPGTRIESAPRNRQSKIGTRQSALSRRRRIKQIQELQFLLRRQKRRLKRIPRQLTQMLVSKRKRLLRNLVFPR